MDLQEPALARAYTRHTHYSLNDKFYVCTRFGSRAMAAAAVVVVHATFHRSLGSRSNARRI